MLRQLSFFLDPPPFTTKIFTKRRKLKEGLGEIRTFASSRAGLYCMHHMRIKALRQKSSSNFQEYSSLMRWGRCSVCNYMIY